MDKRKGKKSRLRLSATRKKRSCKGLREYLRCKKLGIPYYISRVPSKSHKIENDLSNPDISEDLQSLATISEETLNESKIKFERYFNVNELKNECCFKNQSNEEQCRLSNKPDIEHIYIKIEQCYDEIDVIPENSENQNTIEEKAAACNDKSDSQIIQCKIKQEAEEEVANCNNTEGFQEHELLSVLQESSCRNFGKKEVKFDYRKGKKSKLRLSARRKKSKTILEYNKRRELRIQSNIPQKNNEGILNKKSVEQLQVANEILKETLSEHNIKVEVKSEISEEEIQYNFQHQINEFSIDFSSPNLKGELLE